MATQNLNITLEWVQIASPSDSSVLISWEGPSAVEFACTDTAVTPTVYGHLLRPGEAITRSVIGNGYIWARSANLPARMVVTK